MQRIYSIVALLAILFPVASPLWASAETMPYGASCHRMPMEAAATATPAHEHHCHGMTAEQAKAPGEENGPAIAATGSSEQCTMNFFLQSAPPTAAALNTAPALPLLHTTDFKVHSVAIIFSRPGFSSHTDRGPPSLQA